jgi:hypothetical protein
VVGWLDRGVVVGLASCLIAAPGRAQTVHGIVLYTHSDGPVVMATVRLLDPDGNVVATTFTDIDGRFVIPVPADGTYLVDAEHVSAWSMVDGPLELSTRANTMVAFHLQPNPIALEGLDVEVEGRSRRLARTGFYERRKLSAGFFLDDLAIAKRAPIRTSDLIRTVPGVQFIEGRSAGLSGYPIMSYALRSQMWTRSDQPPCFPRVYIDGVVAEQGGSVIPSTGFDNLIAAHDVGGMEVYRSPAETPFQIGGLSACGVIMLWTRGALGRR